MNGQAQEPSPFEAPRASPVGSSDLESTLSYGASSPGTVSVGERAKAISRDLNGDSDDGFGSSEPKEKSALRVKRPSLEALRKGEGRSIVSGMREFLSNEGFSPVRKPKHVESMIKRGLTGQETTSQEEFQDLCDDDDAASRYNSSFSSPVIVNSRAVAHGSASSTRRRQHTSEGPSPSSSFHRPPRRAPGVSSTGASMGTGGGSWQRENVSPLSSTSSGRSKPPSRPSSADTAGARFGQSVGRKESLSGSRRDKGMEARGEVDLMNRARVAKVLAPGVPMPVVQRAAVKIQSVMRVLIARGYVRRKLVSEVTAFSVIMENGIEVIKHPFNGRAKPKNVKVTFLSRKGIMNLTWGGRSAIPLESIYSVVKGIKTEALKRVVGPDRTENCFSLLTPGRTVDFEVDNPWLVLLVARAMRLYLGAHYDTLPAPTFFSHLCVRRKGEGRGVRPRQQTMVWTGGEEEGDVAAAAEAAAVDCAALLSGTMAEDSLEEEGEEEGEGDGDGEGQAQARSLGEVAGRDRGQMQRQRQQGAEGLVEEAEGGAEEGGGNNDGGDEEAEAAMQAYFREEAAPDVASEGQAGGSPVPGTPTVAPGLLG
ncbi:unnamed protein product, partial [Discosporangium mesarthrocarpum]